MIDLLKRLRDNDVEMIVLNNPVGGGVDSIMVKFYKRYPDYCMGTQKYATSFSIEDLEKSSVDFVYLVNTHLDVFLFEVNRKLEIFREGGC